MAEIESGVGLGRIPQSLTNRPFVEDDKASQTLGQILMELRKLNFLLYSLYDVDYTDNEVEL